MKDQTLVKIDPYAMEIDKNTGIMEIHGKTERGRRFIISVDLSMKDYFLEVLGVQAITRLRHKSAKMMEHVTNIKTCNA